MQSADSANRVLVIENEALVSLDLCEMLQDAGYSVIGPANTVAGAIFLLQRERPQAAIIDVWLRDGSCVVLADLLRKCGVPFLVHSVYGPLECPAPEFRDVPWLEKPALPDDFVC